MILTISGPPGSGKSTVAKKIAKRLDYDYFSTGMLLREYAAAHNLTLIEVSQKAEIDKSIDEEIDKRQIEIGRKKDNIVMDGRLSFHFIPNSIKIFINAQVLVRAKRICNDPNREEENRSVEQAVEDINNREDSEKKRFKKYYNVDTYDKENYDFVIDSSTLTPDEIVREICDFINIA